MDKRGLSGIRPGDRYILIALASIKFLIHLFVNFKGGYGIFRDELYYLACADHLSWGYVDHPPFSIYLLSAWKFVFGDSLFSIRFIPALAGGLTVFITGMIVHKLQGGRTAVVMACLAVVAAPVLLAMNTIYSMNSIDILLWTAAAFILITIIEENRPVRWIILGIIIGVGLLNKISMGWFAAGLAVALLLTRQRSALKTIWPYAAGLIALLIFSPYILWNITHDFAHLEFIHNADVEKYAGVSILDFLAGQPLMMLPVSAPIWLAGLCCLLFTRDGREFMILGVIVLAVILILVINGHSKPEYLSPALPFMFAAGAVLVERIVKAKYLTWLRYAIPAAIILMGSLAAPVLTPILPVGTYIKYSKAIGMAGESYEGHELGELHQFYADMFGWENLAATVSKVYTALPDSEKAEAVALVNNYGKAGAIDYFRKKYDLPPVISGHNSYFLWGKGNASGEVVILVVSHPERVTEYYESFEVADTVRCRYCIPYENNLPIYVCRGLKVPFDQIWASLRFYI
jgi:hypothetical protein